MKLPNREKANIPRDKLLKYILSEKHPVGSAKAKFFRKLGFDESNVSELEKAFLKIAKSNYVEDGRKFEFGINYVVNGTIETPSGKHVKVTTVWFAETANSNPRFVTAYPV